MARGRLLGGLAARARAAAVLRQRRGDADSAELHDLWREWMKATLPGFTDADFANLPDEMLRPTMGDANNSGFGQHSDDVRREFLEALEEAEQDHDHEREE